MTDTNCAACRFWVRHKHALDTEFGTCRRYAPRPVRLLDPADDDDQLANHYPSWPNTAEDEFCGEWKAVQ